MGLMRLLLAIAVVICHTGPLHGFSLVRADCAVETFFIISGFYMALVLNEKYRPVTTAANAYKLFLKSRLLRLAPVYLAVLMVTLVVQAIWLHGTQTPAAPAGDGLPASLPYWAHSHLSATSAVLLGLTNVIMLGQDGVMYFGVSPHTGDLYFTQNFTSEPLAAWHFLLIPQAWSLGLELLFYALAPLIVRRGIPTIAFLTILSFGLRYAIAGHGLVNDPWTYRFFPTELCYFLMGSLGYRAYRHMQARRAFRPWWGVVAFGTALGAILLFNETPLRHHFNLYLVLIALTVPLVFAFTKASKWDRWAGELSFPLYICHVLVLQIWRHAGGGGTLAATGASLAVAVALTLLVDQPAERLRQRWIMRRKELSRHLEPPVPTEALVGTAS